MPIDSFNTDSGEKQPSQQQQKIEDQLVGMNCSCGETFLVPLSLSGNAAVCPRCKARVRLPEENFVRIICSCGKPFKVPTVLSGRKGICPQCKRQIKIPEKSEEAACGAAFSPPLGRVDYKDMLSDDQLDEIGQILLTDKLKTNKASPSDGETPITKLPQNNFIRIRCSCGTEFKVPAVLAGKYGMCPACKKRLKIAGQ